MARKIEVHLDDKVQIILRALCMASGEHHEDGSVTPRKASDVIADCLQFMCEELMGRIKAASAPPPSSLVDASGAPL